MVGSIHPQQVQSILNPTNRAVVVLDTSGSRAFSNEWGNIESDALTISGDLEAQGANVGVVGFSCNADVYKNVNSVSSAGMIQAVFEHPRAEGSDGLSSALHLAASMLGGTGTVLVFTDGMADPRVRATVSNLEQQGIQVVALGRQGDNPQDLASTFNQAYLIAG